MSIDPRRTQPFPTCNCLTKECRCSRWPGYTNRWGLPVSGTYDSKVLATGPIAYWPQSETGGVVSHCLVNPLQDGTYTAVTLASDLTGPFGTPAPFYDGATSYNNIFSPALQSAINGDAGTLLQWCKVANVGVWTDATNRMSLRILDTTDNNETLDLRRTAANNSLRHFYEAGGVAEQVITAGLSTTDWFCMAMTWDVNAGINGEVKAYIDGPQVGATQVALGAWAGTIDLALIGAVTTVPLNVWHGWIGPTPLWSRVLSPAEIATVSLA